VVAPLSAGFSARNFLLVCLGEPSMSVPVDVRNRQEQRQSQLRLHVNRPFHRAIQEQLDQKRPSQAADHAPTKTMAILFVVSSGALNGGDGA
jgi:hypothetical protein